MKLSVLQLHLIFAFICATSSTVISEEGGKVIFSSTVAMTSNKVMSIEVVDMKNPQIQSNRRYSDFVEQHCLAIYRNYVYPVSISQYDTCQFVESIFSSVTELISFEMKVDANVIMTGIIDILSKEYAEKAQTYCRSSSIDCKSKELQDFSKILVVFVQETYSNNYRIPNKHVLILLGFIYRFGIASPRYGFAFQGLYTDLSTEHLFVFYDIVVDYFDPERPGLPVLYLNIFKNENIDLKNNFIRFLNRLYGLVIELDPVNEAKMYNRHACMLIISMISCNFMLEFTEILIRLLQTVDLHELMSSSRFAKSASALCNFLKDAQPEPALLTYISVILIKNDFILTLKPSNYLNFGSIFYFLKSEQKITLRSSEANDKLAEIEDKYIKYKTIIDDCISIFSGLNNNFVQMDTSELDNLSALTSKFIEISPDFFAHQQSEASHFNINLLQMIPNLVKSVMLESWPEELSLKRYKTIVQLLQLGMSGPSILHCTTEAFSIILLFYNLKISKIENVKLELTAEHEIVLDLLFKMTKGNKFFLSNMHRMVLYTHLQFIRPEVRDADRIMNELFLEALRIKSHKVLAISDIAHSVLNLKIEANDIFSIFIGEEIEKYLQNSAGTPLGSYQNGMLVLALKVTLIFDVLTKTEQNLIKTFLTRF